jgi:anti-sigma factor RsiW
MMKQRDPYKFELLSAYLDGETSPDESAYVQRLLADDGESSELLEQLQNLRQDFQLLEHHQLDADFPARVLVQATQLNAEEPREARPAPALADRSPIVEASGRALQVTPMVWLTLATAATLLIAFVLVYQPADNGPAVASSDGQTRREVGGDSDGVTAPEAVPSTSTADVGRGDEAEVPIRNGAPEDLSETDMATAGSPDGGTQANQRNTARPDIDSMAESIPPSLVQDSAPPPLAESSQPGAGDVVPEFSGAGGLLLVIDVELTDRGRQQQSFQKLLVEHGIAIRSPIRADSELEQTLLASRYLTTADAANHEVRAKSGDSPPESPRLLYVMSTTGRIDQLWHAMVDRSDRFVSASLDAAMKPMDLAVFRELNQTAEKQWHSRHGGQPEPHNQAFPFVLSSAWRAAPSAALRGLLDNLGTPPVGESSARQSSEQRPAVPANSTDNPTPAPAGETSQRWLDENMRAEVLFLVR